MLLFLSNIHPSLSLNIYPISISTTHANFLIAPSIHLTPSNMAAWGILKNILENAMPDSRSPWVQLLPSASSVSIEIFGDPFNPSSSSTSPLSEHPPFCRPPLQHCIDSIPSVPRNPSALENFSKLCCFEKTSSPHIPKSLMSDSTATTMEEGRIEYMRTKSTNERSVGDKLSRNDAALYNRSYSDVRQRTTFAGGKQLMQNFPPPITMIGSGGKPRVYFKSLRKDGRFVLKEIRIPTQRLLHATRRDGRLTIRVLRPEDNESEKNQDGRVEEENC